MFGEGDAKLVNRFSVIWHSQENYLYNGQGLAFEEALLAGLIKAGGYIFGEVGYAKFFANRIRYLSGSDTAEGFRIRDSTSGSVCSGATFK